MKKFIAIIIAFFMVIALTGCKKDPELSFSKTEYEMIVGEDLTLEPIVKNIEGVNLVAFESNDPTIVTVDKDGKVVAIKEGSAKIIAKIKTFEAASVELNITVNKVSVSNIVISGADKVIKGESITLTATVTPDNVTYNEVKWESADASIATVDKDGKVTAVNFGEVEIKAIVDGFTVSKKITVEHPQVSSVIISGSNSLPLGKSQTLTVKVLPEDALQGYEWSVSDETIASIDENGTITTLKEGTVVFTAKATDGSGVEGVFELTVDKPLVESITASPEATELKIAETTQLSYTILPANAVQTVTWTSSDTEIATVDANGLVTAISGGTAIITATAVNGKTANVSITVLKEKIKIGTNEYDTIADALAAAVEGDVIVVPAGKYDETLTITKNNITLSGPYAGDKEFANRIAEAILSGVITVSKDVSGFKVDGFQFTSGGQVLLEEGVSNLSFQYNTMVSSTKDGVVRGPAEGSGAVYNIKINYNYSESLRNYRFGHFASTIDGLEMIGNEILDCGGYDFLNVGGMLKGKVLINDNTYINSLQSFLYVKFVGVMDCTIKGNYVEGTANTIIDFRDMKEDGAVKILIENNEFRNAGTGWGAIRVRSAGYDEKDTLEVIVKDNIIIECQATEDPRFINNPSISSDGTGAFDKIYVIGRNYYEVNGAAYTDLKDVCFGGAAKSFEKAYDTIEEVPGF